MKLRSIAFLAVLCVTLAPAARAQPDCAQCLALCAKNNRGQNDYPDDDGPQGLGVAVRHNNPEAQAHFVEGQRNDPAFGGRDLVGALRNYREAVKLDPTNPQYRNFLAAALLRAGNAEEAIYNLRQAVRLVPNEPKYQVNLGYALHRTGDEARALVQYMRALMLDPRDVRARLYAAFAMSLLGMRDEAVLELRRVLVQEPGHEAARRALMRLDPSAVPRRPAGDMPPPVTSE